MLNAKFYRFHHALPFSCPIFVAKLWKSQATRVRIRAYNKSRTEAMGVKQIIFSDYEQTTSTKRTRKEKFLAEIDQVVSWQPLLDLN